MKLNKSRKYKISKYVNEAKAVLQWEIYSTECFILKKDQNSEI